MKVDSRKSHETVKVMDEGFTIGRVRGYASVFGVLERGVEKRTGLRTIWDAGAFGEWTQAHRGESVPFFYLHQLNRIPVGRGIIGTDIMEDQVGLRFNVGIFDTTDGRDLLKAVEGGAVNAASHFFRVLPTDYYNRNGATHYRKADEVAEISLLPCRLAGNQATITTVVPADESAVSATRTARLLQYQVGLVALNCALQMRRTGNVFV